MPYITTLGELIDATNDERSLSRDDVAPRVLQCRIWQAMVSLPGCLPHASMVARSRKACAGMLRDYMRDEEGRVPRAAASTLRSGEGCYYGKRYAYEIVQMKVRGLF